MGINIQWSKHSYGSPGIEDLFWRYAELDGANSALVLRQLKSQTEPGDPDANGNIFLPCWLAYIKLVPLLGIGGGKPAGGSATALTYPAPLCRR